MDVPHNVGNPPLFIKAVFHPCPLSLVMGDLTSHKRLANRVNGGIVVVFLVPAQIRKNQKPTGAFISIKLHAHALVFSQKKLSHG